MRNPSRRFGCFLLIVALGDARAQVRPTASSPDTAANRLGSLFLSRHHLAGLSIGLYDHGKTYFYNFGTAQAGTAGPPTSATIYEIGSISKTFTSLLLAQAVQEKKVRLTDDVRRYLRGSYPNLAYQGRPIQLVDLANTTSALPNNLPDRPEIFQNPYPDSTAYLFNQLHQHYTRAQFFADLHQVKLTRQPGTHPAHSNTATELLGYILEDVYRVSYAELVRRRITGPLGMAGTLVAVAPAQVARLATGHRQGRSTPFLALADLQAAGGLRSSPADMVRYLKAQLAEQDPAIRLSHQFTYGQPPANGIGLSWVIARTADSKQTFSHSGGTYGFASYSSFCPALHRGLVLLTNENNGDTEGALSDLAATLTEAIYGVPAGLQALRAAFQRQRFAQATQVYAQVKQQYPALYLDEDYLNTWGYNLLRQGKKQPALELFRLNTQLYPASANTYDSLAEACEAAGEWPAAIANYRRSLALNPANTNAVEHLRKLEAAGAGKRAP